jgi:hypothetical protein
MAEQPVQPLVVTDRVLKALVDRTKRYVADQMVPLQRRIAELEDSQLKFFGVHEEGRKYPRGSLVQRDGSLWLALHPTDLKPGTADSGWKLTVKKGSFG